MPLFPIINETKSYQQVTDAFLGYNHNLKTENGEFFDMENLTSSFFPVLSPRGPRGVYAAPTSPQGLIDKDTLCYVDGSYFVMDNYRVDMGLSTDAADCPKTLISMGAYVIILPDKKYINTKDLTDFGSIEASVTTATTVTFSLCSVDGAEYSNAVASDSAPENPSNLDYWIDTGSTPHALKQWNETSSMWITIATTYVKISATGIGTPFAQHDGVSLSGITKPSVSGLNGTTVLWAQGEDYIVVTGILDAVETQDEPITISRTMPYMDYITESNNRLWGCRYGVARNGEVVNEIYACKLGDFKNWDCFMGISTDSYVASCGTDGQFTGAVTHLGYPIFFKENYLHKIYGAVPANFQIQTTACRGAQRGCSRSLCIVNEVLYYKSRSAVCAYDGSLPVEISKALGDEAYSDAVAGGIGNKYYVAMKDTADVWHLFVRDTVRGLWHKEDGVHPSAFCASRGELYFIDETDKKIKTILGGGTQDTEPVHWFAETGEIGILEASGSYSAWKIDHKYISRLVIRMSLPVGSKVSFYIQHDSYGEWEHAFTMRGTSLRSFSVSIRPKRCDHFRLRIVGEGDAKIYSFVGNIEQGSDLH